MSEDRPSPEVMLARAAEEEAKKKRGRLKVFFGMAPGVGKTYAMLEAGLARRKDGLDVVLGWVETHGRAETEALAAQLERLPPKLVAYRNIQLREFDLDAALQRRPGLLLVDELPHTNAPGSRHHKRWQDVQELVEAGVDVYTTLNVQHLESTNDVVAQITGVHVRETVPDAVFDAADEIELVDLAPDDLLRRLKEGKVYLGDAADRAAANFLAKGNLIALRELAMRRGAERVDAQVLAWRREQGISEAWTTGERLLVAIGPAPQSADLVRATYRMATRLRAPWIAATVENTATDRMGKEDRERVRATLALAERLGGETVILRGESVAQELVDLARQRNVSRIVAGKPTHSRVRDRITGSLVEALIRRAEGIDVLVTTGEPEEAPPSRPQPAPQAATAPFAEWVEAFLWVAGAGAFGFAFRPWVTTADQAMVHVLAVVIAATRLSRWPSLFAAVASVAVFDFLFVPPFYTFAVSDVRFLATFGVMLIVGVVVSRLTGRIRDQAESARQRERRTAALYAMTREFAVATDPGEIARLAVSHVRELYGVPAVLWLKDGDALVVRAGGDASLATDPREIAVARWVVEHGRPAGRGTDTLPAVEALHLPLAGTAGTIGALAVAPKDGGVTVDQRLLLDTFASKTAQALERALLAAETERARLAVETERLRNELLSAVSHDLRTPLAAITGSVTAVLQGAALTDSQRELLLTVREEGERLGRLLADLLDLTRIESGALRARRDWHPVEDVIHGALGRLDRDLHDRPVHVDVPQEVLLAPMDPTLIEQVLVNLLENATKYSPAGTPIDVVAASDGSSVCVEVADRGPGLPVGQEDRVFERFFRAADGQRTGGAGLGLAICRAVLKAHGGRIAAENREGGGASFRFWLPLDADAPEPPP